MRKLFCLILLVALSGSLQAQNPEVTTIDLVNQSIDDCKAQDAIVSQNGLMGFWREINSWYQWYFDMQQSNIPNGLRNIARRITVAKDEIETQFDILNSVEISAISLKERAQLSNDFQKLDEYEYRFLFIVIDGFEYLCTLLARKNRNEDYINDVKQKLHTTIVELEFKLEDLENDIGIGKKHYDFPTDSNRR